VSAYRRRLCDILSAYRRRLCDIHGEWEQDVDDPHEECPYCVAIGVAQSQRALKEKEKMQEEIDRLKKENERLTSKLEFFTGGVYCLQRGYIGDFIKGEVKPEKYERPDTRPAPSPKPPKKKKDWM